MVNTKDMARKNLFFELDNCINDLSHYDINAMMPLLYVLCAHHEGHLVSIVGENGSLFNGKMRIQPIEVIDGYESSLLKEIRQLVSPSYFEGQSAEIVYNFYSKCNEYIDDFYQEIIEHILALFFQKVGIYSGEWATPPAVAKLMGYFIMRQQPLKVYDPCAGLCSFTLLNELQDVSFVCSEIDPRTKVLADIRINAAGRKIELYQEDSTFNWRGNDECDCLASELPFGLRLSRRDLDARRSLFLEDYVISKFLETPSLTSAVLLVSAATCTRSNNLDLRQTLCEKNYIDAVIRLPRNIFPYMGVDSVILVLKKGRSDNFPILMVNGDTYVTKNNKTAKFDLAVDSLIEAIESASDSSSVIKIPQSELDANYNLLPNRYFLDTSKVEHGVSLADLIQIEQPRSYRGEMWMVSNFSDDWNKCNLKARRLNDNTNRRVISNTGDILMVQFSHGRLMLGTIVDVHIGEKVAVGSLAIAFRISNPQRIQKKYLLYALKSKAVTTQVQALASGEFIQRVSTRDFQKIVIPCPSLSEQDRIIREAEDKYMQQLGLSRTSSDIAHMLGTPSVHIGNALKLLEFSNNLNADDRETLAYLKDNFEYMDRLLKMNSILDFSSQNRTKLCLFDFIKDYITKWKSFGSNTFKIEFDGDENASKAKVMANHDALMIMFDCLFDNANRHGFHKKKCPDNEMAIILLSGMKEGRPYLMLRVGNNGTPLASDFTLNDYITRGRYKSNSGRSGLGGYHVNAIVQSMDGEINSVQRSAEWTAFEFLIPIVNQEELDNNKYIQI